MVSPAVSSSAARSNNWPEVCAAAARGVQRDDVPRLEAAFAADGGITVHQDHFAAQLLLCGADARGEFSEKFAANAATGVAPAPKFSPLRFLSRPPGPAYGCRCSRWSAIP